MRDRPLGLHERMNVQLPVRMEKQAFLAWAQRHEERYELDRGRVIMMTGGSRAHWQITANLFKALRRPHRSRQWAILPEFGVDLEQSPFASPTSSSIVADEALKDLTATAPVLIAEVIVTVHRSGSTSATKPPNICHCEVYRPIWCLHRMRAKRGFGRRRACRNFRPGRNRLRTKMSVHSARRNQH